MKDKFVIYFKKKKWWHKRKIVTVQGENYFVSDTEDGGVPRFVIFNRKDGRNKHVFIADMRDILYIVPPKL